jgi:UDP-N-acetylglucosamine--N-acetylmuramyl-(pentapeptide) pyrophosphoryl-undecaprenol N-acetylglucosamine transferase
MSELSAGASRTVVVAAGGTGGHLFPASAFSQEMRGRGWRVVLMTDARGRRYAENFPADRLVDTPAATIQGLNPIRALLGGMKIVQGIAAAKRLLQEIDPAVAIGFGGYPSLPALWAARAQGRPILIHEQNAVLGRVNRYFAKDAAVVACAFERLDRLAPASADKKFVTGNPVRPPIRLARETPYPELPAGAPIRIMVIGGSQGARILGDVIPAAIGLLPANLRARLVVTQQTREEQLADVRAAYAGLGVTATVEPFFTDMGPRLAQSHLVIARAGASTVTELQVVGRPAILVPLAIAADDHQTANAEGLAGVGAADVMREADFTAETLAATLEERLSDPHRLAVQAAAARAAAHPDAAARLADIAEALAAPAET